MKNIQNIKNVQKGNKPSDCQAKNCEKSVIVGEMPHKEKYSRDTHPSKRLGNKL